jgi:hypothetical protein
MAKGDLAESSFRKNLRPIRRCEGEEGDVDDQQAKT